MPRAASEQPVGAAAGAPSSTAVTPLLPPAPSELANVPSPTERCVRRGRPRKSSIGATPSAIASGELPVKLRGRRPKNSAVAPTTPDTAGETSPDTAAVDAQEQANVSTPIPVRRARNPRKRVMRQPSGASSVTAALQSLSDSEPDASHSSTTRNSETEFDSDFALVSRVGASGSKKGRGVQKKRARLDTIPLEK